MKTVKQRSDVSRFGDSKNESGSIVLEFVKQNT